MWKEDLGKFRGEMSVKGGNKVADMKDNRTPQSFDRNNSTL